MARGASCFGATFGFGSELGEDAGLSTVCTFGGSVWATVLGGCFVADAVSDTGPGTGSEVVCGVDFVDEGFSSLACCSVGLDFVFALSLALVVCFVG